MCCKQAIPIIVKVVEVRSCQSALKTNFFFRSTRPKVFYKKGVLRNFAKFTGKHLCQSLFFNKVAGLLLLSGEQRFKMLVFVFFSLLLLLLELLSHSLLIDLQLFVKSVSFFEIFSFLGGGEGLGKKYPDILSLVSTTNVVSKFIRRNSFTNIFLMVVRKYLEQVFRTPETNYFWEKKLQQKQSPKCAEAATKGVIQKKLFPKIKQYSQESTCDGVSSLLKRDSNTSVFL